MPSIPDENSQQIIALSGGVGGAKLALGLANADHPYSLTVVANTADDFEHLGLPISPDLDTVMYTLAGRQNSEQGWGLANESWQAMQMLENYGAETWFQLGDQDIATHLLRLQLQNSGHSLSDITDRLRQSLGVKTRLLPMSDDRVRTIVKTAEGDLPFQHYFVRERCAPRVTGFYFDGIETAQPQAAFLEALSNPNTRAIIICPSNPFVSIQPILALRGVKEALQESPAPVIAVSPIVAGSAIKGPTSKMMNEMNIPSCTTSVAEYYKDIVDGFVIDKLDANKATSIQRDLGIEVAVTATVMNSLQDRVDLAEHVLQFAERLAQ